MLRAATGARRVFAAQAAAQRQPSVASATVPLDVRPTLDERTRVASAEAHSLGRLRLYWRLSKGHLSTWVAISAFPGFLVSTPWPVDPGTALALALGTGLTSASAQAMNQLIETQRDSRMVRTRMRPLPTGQLTASEARLFAAATFVAGTGLLAGGCGSASAAAIAAATAGLYAGVYTPLKTISGYNTHVGAVVGSLPVLIGYAVANVSLASLAPWTLFAIQTAWQLPHFYALAWLHKEDYKRGGYEMFPMRDESGQDTARMCVPYLASLAVVPVISAALGATSWMFAVSGLAPLALWVQAGYLPFRRQPSRDTARKFFLHSLWYILFMYGAFTLHATETSDDDARKVLKAKLSSFCVHDMLAQDFWTPKALCPLVASDHDDGNNVAEKRESVCEAREE